MGQGFRIQLLAGQGRGAMAAPPGGDHPVMKCALWHCTYRCLLSKWVALEIMDKCLNHTVDC